MQSTDGFEDLIGKVQFLDHLQRKLHMGVVLELRCEHLADGARFVDYVCCPPRYESQRRGHSIKLPDRIFLVAQKQERKLKFSRETGV